MEALIHIAVGIGLSTAAGFRILVPFLAMGIAAHEGYLTLAPEMTWMGTDAAIGAFAIATVLEVLAYFVPGLNNALDLIELPAASIAGVILTSAVIGEFNPFLRWSLALIAGGGVAGGTEAFTSLARLAGTTTAGPFGNWAVAIAELASAAVLSVIAVLVPLLGLGLLVVLLVIARRQLRRRHRPQVSGVDDGPLSN